MILDILLFPFYVALVSWLVLGGIFFAYPTVQRLKQHKASFGWIVKVPVYVWLLVGILADIGFNATWGTVIFRELPKEWLFTDRLKRHWYGPNLKQKARAESWVERVNKIDPGHV